MSRTQTKQTQWFTSRKDIAAADTSPGVTARKYAALISKAFSLPEWCNAVEVAFRFSGNTDTQNYEVWAAKENGDFEFVCSGVATAGTQTASKGGFWAKAITVVTSLWASQPKSTDVTGNNGIAKLVLDACGRKHWYVIGTAAVSEGHTFSVEVSGY